MVDLCLHCGANEVPVKALAKLPEPAGTHTHRPIPHDYFQKLARGQMEKAGYQIVNEAHALGRDNTRYFGLLEVEHTADDYGLVVGLRNAHDKSIASGICIGSSVFVCDNMCFSGEIVIARKHTVNILRDLPTLMEGIIEKMTRHTITQDERFEAYKATAITHEQAEHTLIEMFRDKTMPAANLGKAIREWDEPTHEVFAEQENVWRLFNAVTEASKGALFQLPRRSKLLHAHCDGLASYAVAA